MKPRKTQVFAAMGGMNQDDSIVSPTANSAGRNAFGLGDYKYALNARIGSSRSDNFGDVETLKGTVEVSDYKVRSQRFNNSDFSSGLTGWSQESVSGGTAWISSSGVKVQLAAFGLATAVSNILYQAAPSAKRVGVRIKITRSIFVQDYSASLIFLSGSTILSTTTVIVGTGVLSNTDTIAKYLSVELPVGCDRIGFQVIFSSLLNSEILIENFQAYDWISGSRPAGAEKVIGKREDKENNLLYYHVYNASGNHCIRYYDPANAAIFELLKWSGLAYTSTSFVSSALIDNYYGFTDRINSPRLIDVWSITDLFLILGADFREFHLSFHRWAPVMPPIVRNYWDTVTNNQEKFQDKVYQFSYRYIYQGHLKSRWSPISNVAQDFVGGSGSEITAIEVYAPGFMLDDPGAAVQYNYFGHDDLMFTSVVEDIEFGYRESSLEIWRILKRADVKTTNNTLLRYSGDANSTPIPTDDFSQLFDTVPFLAGSIEAIDNRFMFADCLDELDVAPAVQVTDVGVVKYDGSSLNSVVFNFGVNNQVDNASIYSGMTAPEANQLGLRNNISDTTFKGRGIYKTGIQWLHKDGWRSAVYTSDAWINTIPAETGIVDKIYGLTFKFPASFRPPEWAVAYQIMRTNCLNIDYFMFGAANSFVGLIDEVAAYVDNLEAPEFIRNRVRQHFEDARSVTAQQLDDYLKILSKKPFHKSIVSDVRRTALSAALADASRLYIDVNNWYNSSKKNSSGTQNNPMNNLYYNYREGDRVRFLASTNAAPTTVQKVVYDMPILEFTGKGIIVEKPDGILWLPPDIAGLAPSDNIIEVYTPKIPGQADYIYYETGEWYPVLYPGTEQRDMAKRDWTYTNNASVTCSTYGDILVFNKRPFTYGDCHTVFKDFYFNIISPGVGRVATVQIPSMNPDIDQLAGVINNKDIEDFWEKNNGRPSPAYTDLPVVKFKPTQVRFGGQIVEESFVNNINRFRDEDQKIYPSEYGRIRALVNTANAQVESVGSIMLAIGERETFSIYVNRVTLEDLSGRSQVALSDKVLGSYNTLLGAHGTLNPESVSTERGRVYFWDALDGSWVRYGRDGLTEISFYKMRNWFRELAALVLNQYGVVNPIAVSEFDPYNEELVTFINHSVLPATFRDYATYKGAMFSEADTRWKSIHSYQPEMFGKINTQLVSFVGGSLYLHEQLATRSTFYGVKYDVMIEPVFNEEPPDRKGWKSISVIASHKWSVDRFLSEYRGAKTKQQSSLTLAQFQDVEDSYYAAIKNDVNSVNVVNPIITGNEMRSKALRALLKLDPAITAESLLHYVQVGDEDSPKNL
jgi:hypothetical protein